MMTCSANSLGEAVKKVMEGEAVNNGDIQTRTLPPSEWDSMEFEDEDLTANPKYHSGEALTQALRGFEIDLVNQAKKSL